MKKRTSKEILAETMLELSKDIPADKITVKKIIEESGLSIKTFYNHFSDKYALMTYIDESEVERMNEKMKTMTIPKKTGEIPSADSSCFLSTNFSLFLM